MVHRAYYLLNITHSKIVLNEYKNRNFNMSDYNKQIGKRLKELRKSKDLTQKELAAKMGVKYQNVQRDERGLNGVSVSKLKQICDALNITMVEFFSGVGILIILFSTVLYF